MKTLFASIAVSIIILASSFAQAKSPLVKSFQGKIHNYTSLSHEDLEVHLTLDCSYTSGFVWPESKSCGYQSVYVPVNSDGTYTVPNMPWQGKSSIGKYTFSLSIKSKLPSKNYDRSISFTLLHGKEIRKAQDILREVSIYELPQVQVNAITPTGEDYASWRGFIGTDQRDPCVEIVLVLITQDKIQINSPFEVRNASSDDSVPGVLPRMYLGTKGNPGANLKVNAKLYHFSSKPHCEPNSQRRGDGVEFSGTLNEVHNYFNNSTYRVD